MTSGTESEKTVKVCVRMLDSVNIPLRDRVRFQGELAAYVAEAILTVDLDNVPLVVIRDPKSRDTTLRLPQRAFERLDGIRKRRKTSINALVNTAVAHWLEGKDAGVRFRDGHSE